MNQSRYSISKIISRKKKNRFRTWEPVDKEGKEIIGPVLIKMLGSASQPLAQITFCDFTWFVFK